jgi:hypothetical protein
LVARNVGHRLIGPGLLHRLGQRPHVALVGTDFVVGRAAPPVAREDGGVGLHGIRGGVGAAGTGQPGPAEVFAEDGGRVRVAAGEMGVGEHHAGVGHVARRVAAAGQCQAALQRRDDLREPAGALVRGQLALPQLVRIHLGGEVALLEGG